MAKKTGKRAAAKKGRPQLYDKKVHPYIKKIEEMALQMTEAQIAKTLGIAYSTFRKYKTDYSELDEALRRGRAELVISLKSDLIRKAHGFQYTEKKTITEHNKVIREEIYTKASLPDVAAINLLLKNYDPDNWANDPQALALQKEIIELKKKQAEENDW